jgi:pathogenesis-related protein 1
MKILAIICSVVVSSLVTNERIFPASPGEPLDQLQIDLMVNQHNLWREKVGCGPLKWSPELAKYAQQWADQLASRGCEMKHRPPDKYGENIYWSSGMKNLSDHIVDSWASEIEFYNEKKNSCKNGAVCGHYTQVVWCDTKEVGCGMARCGGEEIWVCNYNPPGNYIGQRPYPIADK